MRQKTITFLSVSGMSVAIAIVLMIGFWSMNEFSFDTFHKNSGRIYRVCLNGMLNGQPLQSSGMFAPAGAAIASSCPKVQSMNRVRLMGKEKVQINNLTYYIDDIITTDSNFFQFFTYKIISGDIQNCLQKKDGVVIDQSTANKLFPGENAVGNFLGLYHKNYQVTAVMEDMPKNTYLKAHIVVPLHGIDWIDSDTWGSSDAYMTFLLVNKNTNIPNLTEKVTAAIDNGFPSYKEMNIKQKLQLLTDIHFSSEMRFDFVEKGNKRVVVIFISLAGLILLISSINFINLSISTSFLKSKSIGIKKINGCSKLSLFTNSYIETGLSILTSFLIAIIITAICLPVFKHLSGSDFHINFSNYRIYTLSLLLIILITAIAGTIPMVYILKFNPETIVRNRIKGEGVSNLQRILVISQFAASIILLVSSGIVKKQIYYVQNKDLGFDKSHIVYFHPGKLGEKYNNVKELLLKDPNIKDVTATHNLPTNWSQGNPVMLPNKKETNCLMEIMFTKGNYINMLKIPLVQGINPFLENDNDKISCLINESAVKKLHLKDPVGKQIKISENSPLTIAGVLKDVNTKSLHKAIDPQVYRLKTSVKDYEYMMVKVSSNTKEALQSLKKVWHEYNGEDIFEYHFLDSKYDDLYKTETTASKIISIGMIIAIFLAFMGLYAIAFYSTERRVKEVGIRKVNGAKIVEVMLLLNKDFIKWMVIAFAIAIPISYYAMHKWLENFAYKTVISWWIFALAGSFAFVIALTTVSWQSWKAATSNPVEALRNE